MTPGWEPFEALSAWDWKLAIDEFEEESSLAAAAEEVWE
jgi:hypothetical protein